MKLIRDLTKLPGEFRAGAIAIGNYDGVHLGHARIVRRLLAHAEHVGGLATIFTFEPHPVRLLRPAEAPPPLTWLNRKAELLEALGVHAMVAYPTDEAFLALSPRAFFDQIVVGRLAAKAIVEGPNFFFGHNRQGNIGTLDEYARGAGIELEIVPPLEIGGEVVSSSRVRRLVAAGLVDEARGLLTEPYRIRGLVTHGAGRGARLGFPTANVAGIDTLVPGTGVYAGRAIVSGGACWPAAVHIGPNPTFSEQALKVEVHLIGFEGSLYGQPLEVDLLSRLRDVVPFADVSALREQLKHDVACARDLAAKA